jgi:hypothetical protein
MIPRTPFQLFLSLLETLVGAVLLVTALRIMYLVWFVL